MSNIWDGYADSYDAAARLTILKSLDFENSKTLNDSMIFVQLKAFGFQRGREHMLTQLAWLEQQGAVDLICRGNVIIAELKQLGADHLRRDQTIVGVQQPSLAR